MRVSARHDDPGYRPDHVRMTVFFNGTPQSRNTGREIITADEERGEILYYVYEDGKPVLHPFKRETIWERVEQGEVRVSLVNRKGD